MELNSKIAVKFPLPDGLDESACKFQNVFLFLCTLLRRATAAPLPGRRSSPHRKMAETHRHLELEEEHQRRPRKGVDMAVLWSEALAELPRTTSPSTYRSERSKERIAAMRWRVDRHQADDDERISADRQREDVEKYNREGAQAVIDAHCLSANDMIPRWARESTMRVHSHTAANSYFETTRPLQKAGGAGAWGRLESMSSTSTLASHRSPLRASASSSALLERTGNAEGGRDTLQATAPHVLLNVSLGRSSAKVVPDYVRFHRPPALPAKRALMAFERAYAVKNEACFREHLRVEKAHRLAETDEWHTKMNYHRSRQLLVLGKQHDTVVGSYPSRAFTASASWANLSDSSFLPTRATTPQELHHTSFTESFSPANSDTYNRDLDVSRAMRPPMLTTSTRMVSVTGRRVR